MSEDLTPTGDFIVAVDPALGREFLGRAVVSDSWGRVGASLGTPAQFFFTMLVHEVPTSEGTDRAGSGLQNPGTALAVTAGAHTQVPACTWLPLIQMATDLEVDIAEITSVCRGLGSSHAPLAVVKYEQRVRPPTECSGEHIRAIALAHKFGGGDYLSTSSAVHATCRRIMDLFAAGAVHAEARDHSWMPSVRASLTSEATGVTCLSEGLGNAVYSLTRSISDIAELYASTKQYLTAW